MLPKLIGLPNASAMTDSEFNKSELVELGMPASRISVVPPFHQVEELLKFSRSNEEESNDILVVGRIAPNKGLGLLLEAFADVAERVQSNLHIVGRSDPRLLSYRRELDAIIDQRRIANRVIFHGSVSQDVLATLYSRCALFWTCSQHEGFCVPVVEAMAFGKPIVATALTALPETCGEGAILANTREDMVAAVLGLLNDERKRCTLGELARRRYEAMYSPQRIGDRFSAALNSIADVP